MNNKDLNDMLQFFDKIMSFQSESIRYIRKIMLLLEKMIITKGISQGEENEF